MVSIFLIVPIALVVSILEAVCILLNKYIGGFDLLTVPIALVVSIFLTVPLDQSFDS